MDEWVIFRAIAMALALSGVIGGDDVADAQATNDSKQDAIVQAKREHQKQQAFCIKYHGWAYVPTYTAGKAGCTHRKNQQNHIYPVVAV